MTELDDTFNQRHWPPHEILARMEHRPWPLPTAPWVMVNRWRELLFAHWPVRLQELHPHVPAALEIETWEGYAWLGVVPFRMENVRPRWAPPLPWISAFPELNVRTYVQYRGTPGVYFFSLDASNPLAVAIARSVFRLPYYNARMNVEISNSEIHYHSRRTHRNAPPAELIALYRPSGEPYLAAQDTIEHWLTERYCFFTLNRRGDVVRCDIHHAPWPLQPAEVEFESNTMLKPLGVSIRTQPLAHYAHSLDVLIWPLVSA